MNRITKGTNSVLIFTLEEKRTLTSPFYLVRMQSRAARNNVKRFILPSEQSSYTGRFNQFTITESTTEVLTSGTVSLTPEGFWDYAVYEQSSSTNLHEDSATNTTPLEEGLMVVRSQNANSDTYYTDTSPDEDKFYGQ